MNLDMVRQVADAVLYEGYMLYPYRPTSIKNRQRWTFGGLYPERYVAHAGNTSSFESQFLVQGGGPISVIVRFLHLLRRPDGLEEGIPREVGAGPFRFPALEGQLPVEGMVELVEESIAPDLRRITLCVRNLSGLDDPMAMLTSTHAIVEVTDGSFLSLIDPPEQFRQEAAACRNRGVWPVLAGNPGSDDHLLISPIILYDYPQIAPESGGDFFDATEIDEILSLRIMTLTDQEKDEIRSGDPRIRRVLERTESLSEQDLMKLHGVLRNPQDLEGGLPGTVLVAGVELKRGDRVRLCPRNTTDIFDLALTGQLAEIDTIEVDFEDRVHLAVVLENDPGRDLGVLRQPGHRFFFSPEEVEPVE